MKSFLALLIVLHASLSIAAQTVDKDNTLSADRPLITCPIKQNKVRNGDKPSLELCKLLIRCRRGELPASKGYDGAVTVDVSNVQMEATRKWDLAWDGANGTRNTIVWPVRATCTRKTFYRTRTEIAANEVLIFSFYVNAYGEWAISFQELVKPAENSVVKR